LFWQISDLKDSVAMLTLQGTGALKAWRA